MRRIVTVITPFIILLIAWVAAAKADLASDTIQALVGALPYILAVIAIIMCVWYQYGNTFYLIFFILFTYIFMNAASKNPAALYEVVMMTSILLPINIVLLTLSKERGITGSSGRNKAIIIFGQITWIFINMIGNAGAQAAADTNAAAAGIETPAIVIYVLAAAIIVAAYILKRQYITYIYIITLAISYIYLYFANNRPILVSVFISALFCIVVIALFDLSYSLVFYDTLTGVLSRRALEQEVLRLGSKYCAAMVDIDRFKNINDCHGHDVGDEVLKMAASTLRKTAGNAKVFRYGGEEFVVLFKDMPYNKAVIQLDNMRKAIERRPFVIRAQNRPAERPERVKNSASKGAGTVNVTVSIGVAQRNDLLKTWQDVIRKADEAMYRSKNAGRNIVTKA